jgi:hypothetical protein
MQVNSTYLLDLKKEKTVKYNVFSGDISYSENIWEYQLSEFNNGQWRELAKGSSVGHKRIELFEGKFSKLKLEILDSKGKVYLKNSAFLKKYIYHEKTYLDLLIVCWNGSTGSKPVSGAKTRHENPLG